MAKREKDLIHNGDVQSEKLTMIALKIIGAVLISFVHSICLDKLN